MIVETVDILTIRYGLNLSHIFFEDIRIGVFKTAVKLTGERYGVAGTIIPANPIYRDFGPFTTNQIIGQDVASLFRTPSTPIVESLKIATLNALSANIIQQGDYRVVDGDPIDLADLSGQKTITIVGAFKGYIRKIGATNHQMHIVELNKDAIPEAYQPRFVPIDKAGQVIPESDIVIITGSSIINNTLIDLLPLLPKSGTNILVGPSSSFVPDVLFAKGFDIIGATRITDPPKLMQTVSEAGTGFHFFRYCAKKICIVNDAAT